MNQVSLMLLQRLAMFKTDRILLECVQDDIPEVVAALEETARFLRSEIKPKATQVTQESKQEQPTEQLTLFSITKV
jgi:hypothetical protein